MNRLLSTERTLHPLVLIVVAGLVLRFGLFDVAPVHADAGLFLYDGLLALQGNVPTLDYYSRSILFHYLLAGTLWFDISPLLGGRVFMIVISIGISVLLYHFTRIIHSKRAGLAASAVFLFTPFSAFWGMYIKTQLAAELFVIASLIVIFRHLDDVKIDTWVLALGGMLLALAFLVRLVVLVHFGTILLFVFAYRLAYTTDGVFKAGVAATAVGAGSVVTLLLIFIGLGGPQNIDHFLDVTVFGLIQSQASSSVAAESSAPSASLVVRLVGLFCPECGVTQLKLIAEIILVSLPAMLGLLIYWKSFLQSYVSRDDLRTLGFLGIGAAIFLWGVYLALVITHFEPPVSYLIGIASVIVAIVAYAAVIKSPQIEFENLWNRKVTFVFLLLGLLFLAHMQRDRVFNHSYFLTLFPYVSILVGIAIVGIYEQRSRLGRFARNGMVIAIACSYLIATVSAPFIAAPWGGLVRPYSLEGPGTVSGVQEVGMEIRSRTPPGEPIFTVQPIFALEADRPVLLDLSRTFWPLTFDPDDATSRQTAAEINSKLRSGEVRYVILDRFMGLGKWSWTSLFEAHPQIQRTVANEYCPVDEDDPLYERYDISLYERSAAAPACNDLLESTPDSTG